MLVALCLFASAQALAAPSRSGPPKVVNCMSPSAPLAQALCADPALLDDATWVAQSLKDRLAAADGATRRTVSQEQRAFEKERNKCLPKAPEPEPQDATPPRAAAVDAPPTKLAGQPPAAGEPPAKAAPPIVDPEKPADPLPDAQPAPAESEDDAGPSAQQVAACLRDVYKARLETLEAPLRHFVDLSVDAPTAPSVCAAVTSLNAEGRIRLLARHAMTLQQIDETNEMHPTVKLGHMRRYLTDSAWKDATSNVSAWQSTLGAVEISRLALDPAEPKLWAFSTTTGDNHDRSVLLFESSADGARGERLAYVLGGPAMGAFDLMFVRFKGTPYAVETTKDGKTPPAVFAMDQSKPVCGTAAGK